MTIAESPAIWSSSPQRRASSGTNLVAPAAPVPARFEEFWERLRALLALPDNWNSYGARRIDRNAAIGALRLLVGADWDGPMPDVSPQSSGGVTLAWSFDEDGVELGLLPSGEVETLVDVEGEMTEGWASAVDDQRVADVLLWVRKLT